MLYAGEVQSMEKRIRALKAIILVVVMIVELFGVDAVRVVAETINVTGDTTISTEDNRDYAVTDCTLTVSSTGNITGTVYGSGGKIVNQGSISKIERNIEVDNQAGASIQDLQSSVGITNAGHITSATYSSTYTLTNSGTIDTLNVQNPGYSGSTATVNMNAGTISSLNVTNYSGMNPVINYAGGTITSLIAEGTNGADLVVSGSHEISQLKGTVNVSGSGMLTVSGALQLEKGYTGEKLGVTKDTALTVKDGYTVQVNYKDHVYSISSATEQKITDLAGNTVSTVMDDAAAATMTVETPFTSETYMYGEQAVAVYLAKDDYYFPEDYQATVTGGSGTLDITRVNAKEIKLAYTFADEKKDIQISLPAANARGTQDAPAGLDGGVKKVTGVTEDMEYAVSETSDTWTQVTGITDSGMLAMEPGTWYFRYKETDEKKVSVATKVIVKGEGVASVEQGDVNYGTKPDPKAETSTNTEKTAVIEYKEASSDDTAYSQTVPTAVGNYTVRATFAETEAYGEAVATTDFSIRYLETPEPPYTLVGTKGENGYYTSNVVVKPAKGYMISTELNGTYVALGGTIAVGFLKTFVVYTLVCLVFMAVFYSLYAFIAGGFKAVKAFWSNIIPSALTSIGTCSSAASVPVNIECTKKMGVPNDIAETTVSLGTSFHKDGSCIGSVFKIMFLVSLFGTSLSTFGDISKVLGIALLATLLVTAVPIGGGTISEMLILTMMNYNVAALPILTIVATIIDAPATLLNVVGDSASAMMVTRVVEGKDWINKKNNKKEK